MRHAFLGAIGAPGQHHVGDAREPDEARQPHRTAAAEEDAAAALGQRVEGAALGHPHMAARRKLEPAADDRAVQHRDDGHPPLLDRGEGMVPGARMMDRRRRVRRGQARKVEPGGEMLALAMDHHRANPAGGSAKKRPMPAMVASSSALRFSGRQRRSTATSSCTVQASESGRVSRGVGHREPG